MRTMAVTGTAAGTFLLGNLQSGDFIEYTTDTFIGEMVVKQTYKEVTATTVTINTTSTVMGMTSYDEQTIPIEQAYGGAEFDVSDPPEGYNVVDKGSQSISTEWGSKSCKHYEVTTSEGGIDEHHGHVDLQGHTDEDGHGGRRHGDDDDLDRHQRR